MFQKYLLVFLVSMVPMIELRGAVLLAPGLGLPMLPSYIVCILGNMLPVPFIHLFARKVLTWGANKRVIGPFFQWCLVKGHRGGEKLKAKGAVLGSHAVCGHSCPRHWRLDRHPGGQLSGYGVQAHCPGGPVRRCHCRHHHDPGRNRRLCRVLLSIAPDMKKPRGNCLKVRFGTTLLGFLSVHFTG